MKIIQDYGCITTVNCEWDKWQLGECSRECGGGVRTNTRLKKINAAFGGNECSGLPTIKENCNIQECPGGKSLLQR